MVKISTSDFQKGIFIQFKGEPHQIVNFQFVNPGKGSAFVRTKLKGIISGKIQDFTFKSGETTEKVRINIREMQYLYQDNDGFIFMDRGSFEQTTLSEKTVGSFYKYLKEGEIYQIFMHGQKAVGMRYPKKVKLIVSKAQEAIRGNTATGAKKEVTLETGIKVSVPLFIKKGDVVFIDPQTGEYLERESY